MGFFKKTVRDIDVNGKKVIMRVDFNVPLKDGVVTDDTRVRAAIPTIKYLKENGAAIILMSHLGRPKGDGFEPALTLKPAADKLAELTGYDVKFVADTYGDEAAEACAALQPGEILVLENVRFLKAEKKNAPEVAKKLASYADIFVLDAFGTAHRAQGSVVGPAAFIPAVAGFLLEKEVDTLTGIFASPKRPFVAVVGGSKVSSKIGVLDHLIDSADTLIIGGGMAYTFFLAKGYEVGKSLQEPDWIERAGEMLKKAEAKGCQILLPIDNVCADHFGEDAEGVVFDSDKIPADMMGMDIGPKTVELYCDAVKKAATVFWNGPMGVFEIDQFAKGTEAVARAIADSDCISIIGGGDSVAAINKFGLADKMSWISTGGGASMELVEGKALPGVEALIPVRKRMIAGNWKMNKTFSEAVVLAEGLAKELADGTGAVDVVVAPPTINLKGVAEVIEKEEAPFALSAQNVYWEEAGAYTGETAPNMLESIGATYCIIGHSERRDYFGETDEDINKKAKALMAHGIVPISCCGESLEIREAGKHVEFVVDQIKKDTAGLEITDPSKYVIAYEPIWAIGTGKTATADDAQEVCGAIRATLVEIFGEQTAAGIRVLYGGSANPSNIAGFLAKEDVDGALVGGASLKADGFADMVRSAMA